MVKTHVEKIDDGIVLEDSEIPEEDQLGYKDDVLQNGYVMDDQQIPLDENQLDSEENVEEVSGNRYAPREMSDYEDSTEDIYNPQTTVDDNYYTNVNTRNVYNPRQSVASYFSQNNNWAYQPSTNFYVSDVYTRYAIEYLRFLRSALRDTMR
jgi:hypothetical protein